MKQHLVKLLLEEYKQGCLFDELATMGLDLTYAEVDLYNTVFDLMGFPRGDDFNRDPLYDKYTAVFNKRARKHKVIGSGRGLVFVSDIHRIEAEKMTEEFVDWLYEELARLPV